MDKNEVITLSSDEESDFTVKDDNHSKQNTEGIEVNEYFSDKKNLSNEERTNEIMTESSAGNIESGTKSVKIEFIRDPPKSDIKGRENLKSKICHKSEGSNQNLKFFTEFVEFCGSLEDVESDRVKLTKKLMKRYGEADCHYIKSEEFRSLIHKFRDKVTKHNLYLIAKEITDELIYRKKIESSTQNSEEACQKNQETVKEVESIQNLNEIKKKKKKKHTKVINKVIKKLDKLGLKIQELEQKEVDLSDEDESAYVQLQRYRERFCQIYTKLCKFTNEVSDIDSIYNRRICFTESKYVEINKCIENWLNKTKRFPDFSDIMKLLESHSSSLNLPSNRDAIRTTAIEIFQKVGSMLQRRRKYDLWDSLCGYLTNEEDPANKDVLLDSMLKKNFEIRIKKEQEIFQHYAELQEKQRLEPEEVPDEEANHSPVGSENEDEEEIENIEEQLNRRLDGILKEDTKGNGDTVEKNDCKKEIPDLVDEVEDQTSKVGNAQSKESKNNYKNCKSLKWRSENGNKPEGFNWEDPNAEQKNERENKENCENELIKEVAEGSKSINDGEDDSDLELIAVKSVKLDTTDGIYDKIKSETKSVFETYVKRSLKFGEEDKVVRKRMRMKFEEDEDLEVFEIDDENENPEKKINEVIDVHCCQIYSDNVFDELDHRKKDWGKRKVFRDLTNLNRLMELQGKKRRVSGLFSSSCFRRRFCDFEKSPWKKKCRVSFRSVGSRDQKCALTQQEKSEKTVNSDSGGDSDEKDIQNNSEGRGDDEGNNFCSGHGNGSEGDNNEDENKKKGRPDVELNEIQREDDEEEEEDENNAESTEHSLPNQKTEEGLENITPSQASNKSYEEESQQPSKTSETPNEEEKKAKEESSVDNGNGECVLESTDESQSVQPESEEKAEDIVIKNEEAEKSKLKEEEETESKSSDVTVVEKQNEDVDVVAVSSLSNRNSEMENECILTPPKEIQKYENLRVNSCTKVMETRKKARASAVPKENANVKAEKTQRVFATSKPATTWKSTPVDPSPQKLRKRSAPSTSDEEIVKRFLLHSPSSISITPPRKLSLSKSPSQAALQALATLRNLKGISTTIVRGKPKDSAMSGSYSRRSDQNNQNSVKGGRNDFPVISNVQTVTPKIVNVSGNVSGFDNSWPGISNATCDSSPIRISNVWGSLPNNFMHTMVNDAVTPGCSSQKSNQSPSNTVKKKKKKTVEYVVLD